MFGFFFMQNTTVHSTIIKRTFVLLVFASIITYVNALQTQSVIQFSFALYMSLVACHFQLNKNKFFHPTAIHRTKKQFFLPLCFSIALATVALGLVFRSNPFPVSTSNTFSTFMCTSFVSLIIIYAFIRLTYKNPNTTRLTNKIQAILLLTAPVVLTLLAAAQSYFSQSNSLAYLAMGVSIFFSVILCILNMRISYEHFSLNKKQQLDLYQIHLDLLNFDAIKTVHSLQTWLITADLFGVKCEISIRPSINTTERIIDEITDYLLQKYEIEHISFQVINRSIEGTLE